MSKCYSNGKLLLTAEYFVLDGAKALALPTKFGQHLTVSEINEPKLVWQSFDMNSAMWLEAVFDLPNLRLTSATYNSVLEKNTYSPDEMLQEILIQCKKLNPEFLLQSTGFLVQTNLNFPRNWGLGTSSTLINNLANWARVNPYDLLKKTFGGSGYDIACGQNDTPIFYTKTNSNPLIESVEFNPSFKNQLYFIHLNKKQNSREGIKKYKAIEADLSAQINEISKLSTTFLQCTSLKEFEVAIEKHENIVSKTLDLITVKEKLFSDYFGAIKSLGAWGGDFILATGNTETPNYFIEKGFTTVLPFNEMIL